MNNQTLSVAVHGKYAVRRTPIQLEDEQGGKSLLIYASRKKPIIHGLSCVCFVVIGVAMMFDQISAGKYGMALAGLLAVGLFGFGIFFFWLRIIDDRPALVFDQQGVFDHTAITGSVRVLWSEIEEMQLHNGFLIARVRDPEAMLAARTPQDQFTLKQNLQFYGSPIHANVRELQCKTEQIEKAIKDFADLGHAS